MSTVLLASGTTPATSSDFILAAGETANLFMFDAAGPQLPQSAAVQIQIKDTINSEYYNVGRLDNNLPSASLPGPGTFRVSRLATEVAVGVGRG